MSSSTPPMRTSPSKQVSEPPGSQTLGFFFSLWRRSECQNRKSLLKKVLEHLVKNTCGGGALLPRLRFDR